MGNNSGRPLIFLIVVFIFALAFLTIILADLHSARASYPPDQGEVWEQQANWHMIVCFQEVVRQDTSIQAHRRWPCYVVDVSITPMPVGCCCEVDLWVETVGLIHEDVLLMPEGRIR